MSEPHRIRADVLRALPDIHRMVAEALIQRGEWLLIETEERAVGE